MIYKENVIEALAELADEAVQRRRWVTSGGTEVSSFTEAMCQLFDDSGLGDALGKGTPVFSKEIDRKLKDLEKMMGKIDEFLPARSLIRDSPFIRVRDLAGLILTEINKDRK